MLDRQLAGVRFWPKRVDSDPALFIADDTLKTGSSISKVPCARIKLTSTGPHYESLGNVTVWVRVVEIRPDGSEAVVYMRAEDCDQFWFVYDKEEE